MLTRRAGRAGRRGRALGVRRRRRVHRRRRSRRPRAAPRSPCTCARARTTCWTARACAPSSAATPTTSSSPSACRRRSGRTARRSEPARTRRSTRPRALWARAKQRHHRRASTRSSTSTSATTSRTRSPGPTRSVEGRQEYTQLLYVPVARALRPLGPQRPPRREALRAPRLHHGRRRAAPARVPALRARRGRLQRPAAQRLARDPAGIEGHRGHPRRLHEEGAGAPRGPRREREGEVRRVLEGLRPRPQGRRGRGLRQQGEDRGAPALRLHPRRHRRPDGLARRLRRAA